ncbi:MAG: histidine kinase [Actinomycetota bacterium]|nr:histidine kinase [Actinomycetota bacterium]
MGAVGLTEGAAASAHRSAQSVGLTVAGWVLGMVTTALILGTPYLVFGYYSPSLHLVLDSIDACVALLLAYLVYGRYVRSHGLQDLFLAEGLALLAVAGLGLTLLIDLIPRSQPATLDVWLPLSLRVIGAALVVAAALAGDRRAQPGRHNWARAVPWVVCVLVFLLLWAVRDQLPVALDQSPPSSAQRPVITGHVSLLLAQGFTAVCFAVASVSFTSQAVRRHDELVRWLGPACALAAFARVNYVLFPSLYSDWIYTGDLLRTGCYLVLLVGAAREIGQYWTAQTRAAVLDDRRRLARELHDGVIQELGYIRSESFAMASEGGRADRILGACDRALDEARGALHALGQVGDEPLGFVLHRAARQVAERHDVQLELDLDDSVAADLGQRHSLMRITREAISNAARHGKAERVRVQLGTVDGGRQLVIEDDGAGFDLAVTRVNSTGYGLVSMRERALALPGSLSVESTPEEGTKVVVAW